MEFSSRGFQRESARPAAAGSPAGSVSPDNKKGSNKKRLSNINKTSPAFILGVILSVSLLILVIATLFGISFKSSESSIVDKDRYQAVFLNGGQAYFGKIKALNERYIDISDIYYISTNGQSDDKQANISLVKLGSELHCPQDRMIVNRDQVLFWENLNDDGKVVNAIKQWQKENPNGQKCNNQTTQQQTPASSSTENDSASSDSSTQNGTSPGSSSNNSSTSNNAMPNATNSNTSSQTPGSTNPSTPTSNSPTTP